MQLRLVSIALVACVACAGSRSTPPPSPSPPPPTSSPEPPAIADSPSDAGSNEQPPTTPSAQVAATPPTEPTAPPGDPTERDPRHLAKQQPSREIIVGEIQALERLYAATPKTSPDRSVLIHRLA